MWSGPYRPVAGALIRGDFWLEADAGLGWIALLLGADVKLGWFAPLLDAGVGLRQVAP